MHPAVHITLVVDKSGSMHKQQSDVIGGFNAFIEAQQAQPGELTITLVLFDTCYKTVLTGVPVEQIPPMTPTTYCPGGNTALIDAMASAILETRIFLRSRSPTTQPTKVLFVVMTDGEENASREFGLSTLRELVADCEHRGWDFRYLGETLDRFCHESQAHSVGISQCTQTEGWLDAYAEVTEITSVLRTRLARDASLRWVDDDETY